MQRSGDCRGQPSGAAWVGERGSENPRKKVARFLKKPAWPLEWACPGRTSRLFLKEAIGKHTTEATPGTPPHLHSSSSESSDTGHIPSRVVSKPLPPGSSMVPQRCHLGSGLGCGIFSLWQSSSCVVARYLPILSKNIPRPQPCPPGLLQLRFPARKTKGWLLPL